MALVPGGTVAMLKVAFPPESMLVARTTEPRLSCTWPVGLMKLSDSAGNETHRGDALGRMTVERDTADPSGRPNGMCEGNDRTQVTEP